MTLKTKVGGEWKEISALKVKIGGEWKDVSTLYSKKDGAWVTVYSSGALITFTNYPYPIPVAKGWKYSTDKVNWTTVTSDSTINNSGTFTGWVKANSISLSNYYTRYTPEQIGVRGRGMYLATYRYFSTCFVNGGKGYVCGNPTLTATDVYDQDGVRSDGASLTQARNHSSSFVNNGVGYVCGGVSDDNYSSYVRTTVNTFDSNGVVSTGNSLYGKVCDSTAFVNGNVGFVCGGKSSSTGTSKTVNMYDSSGVRTTGNLLSNAGCDRTSFVNNGIGYVCGGITLSSSTYLTEVSKYDSSGTRTTGSSLRYGSYGMTSFVNNNVGYVCGGYKSGASSNYVEKYDSNGAHTLGEILDHNTIKYPTSFVLDSKGFVCGGYSGSSTIYDEVYVFDSNGVKSYGTPLRTPKLGACSFVNGSKGYVCGGKNGGNSGQNYVDTYHNVPEKYTSHIPITKGSKYTLNSVSGTADVNKVLEFDSKVSGSIQYSVGDLSLILSLSVKNNSGSTVSNANITLKTL